MQNKIFILTGTQGSGKTSFAIELVNALKEQGLTVGGILAHGFWQNGQRDHFELENILNGKSILFCSQKKQKDWQKIRRFYINPKGVNFGINAILPEKPSKIDILVIDEIGPFELQGKGWSVAIRSLLQKSEVPMVWIVREPLIDEVIAHFEIADPFIFHIKEYKIDATANFILTELGHPLSSYFLETGK